MIPFRLKVVLIIAIVCFFIITLTLLKYKRLALKYTLLWLVTGAIMLVFVAVPELMAVLTRFAGIQSSMNGLFILLIGFLIMLCMSLTSIASGQSERIRRLTQELGILEKRVREIEGGAGEPGPSTSSGTGCNVEGEPREEGGEERGGER